MSLALWVTHGCVYVRSADEVFEKGTKHSITASDGTVPLVSTKNSNIKPQTHTSAASATKVKELSVQLLAIYLC